MTDAIVTDKLTKSYGRNRGIQNIDLRVRRGEIFGLLGPNGAGKSTILRTLLGFMKPTSGGAEIFGLDTRTHAVEIHEHVGNLPGEFSLDDRMTGRQLIDLFARLRKVDDLGFTHELAQRLDANLDRPMRRLSRGNKQKIGIIQAMFHQPELIVLDEPTAGLDPLMQETFLQLLREAQGRGQTVLFSSHILPEIERVADRVGIIREGDLVAVEEPSRLTGRSLRHVRIQFSQPLDEADRQRFYSLPGVENFVPNGTTIAFTAHGSMDEIVKLAARHQVKALDVERPSLEEIFLTFYGTGENGAVQ